MGDLRRLLRRAADSGWDFTRVIAEGVAAGLPAQVVLRSVEPDLDATWFDEEQGTLHAEVEGEDWVESLVAAVGSEHEAQVAVTGANAPACWGYEHVASPVDVADHVRRTRLEHEAQQTVAALVEAAAPFDEIAGAIASEHVAPGLRGWWWERAVRGRAIVSMLRSDCVPDEVVRRELTRRGSSYENLMALRQEVGAEAFAKLGARVLRAGTAAPEPISLWLAAAAESRVALWEVHRQVEEPGAPATWLPAFRRAGFDPTAAALACTEAGLSTAAVGVAMSSAGYADHEILAGLRACGRGIDPVTQALADAGWTAHRLATMLQEGGALEPEVRELLRKVVGAPPPMPLGSG